MSTKKHRSDISKSIHTGVSNLHELGIVDTATMRRFDATCLATVDEGKGDATAFCIEPQMAQMFTDGKGTAENAEGTQNGLYGSSD